MNFSGKYFERITASACAILLGTNLAGCLDQSGRIGDRGPAPTDVFTTTVVSKNADGTWSRATHRLTAAQMEEEKAARASYADLQSQGLVAELSGNPTCPWNDDDVWVYDQANLTGNRCCISGQGYLSFPYLCDSSFQGARSVWGGLPWGDVLSDGCSTPYRTWEVKNSLLCDKPGYAISVGSGPVTLHRGYLPGDHFLTADRNEITAAGAAYDGAVGVCWSHDDGWKRDPLDRLYGAGNSDHLYTTSGDEWSYVQVHLRYRSEGAPCSIYTERVMPELQPLHRFYRGASTEHLYSTGQSEINQLCQPGTGWKYEGVAGYLLAPASTVPANCGAAAPPPPPTCGGLGQQCCSGVFSCNGSLLTCNFNNVCQACGQSGQSCCFHFDTGAPPDCVNGGTGGCNADTGTCL